MIILVTPGGDLVPGFLERQEPVGVQALVPKTPVEELDVGVVRGLSGPGEVQRDAVLVSPAGQHLGDELKVVVDLLDCPGCPSEEAKAI
ncbi:hypothetical protein D3C86_1044010 [compost metagenome]